MMADSSARANEAGQSADGNALPSGLAENLALLLKTGENEGPRTVPETRQTLILSIAGAMERAGLGVYPEDEIQRLKAIDRRYREDAAGAEILGKTADQLVTEHRLGRIVQAMTEAGKEISRAAYGAFCHNIENENLEPRHILSEVECAAFSGFPLPSDTPLCVPTFNGKGPLRFDDLADDPQYHQLASYCNVPQGSPPVRSYLAVPVVSRSGRIIGGLFYGHPEPGMFTEQAEKSLVTLAAQAAVAIDNADLYNALQKEIELGKLREEDARKFTAIVKSSNDAIISKNLNSIVTSWNTSAERMFGYSAGEMIGKPITILIPSNHQNEEPEILGRIQRGETINHYETVRRRKDGSLIQISLTVSPIKDDKGKIIGASKIARDVTDLKSAQEQLRQAQKMEVVGRLAGGIAHDFNNLLTSINGFTDMALAETEPDSIVAEYLEEVRRSGNRAATLTQQLLAYSRKQVLAPKVLDLNACVAEMDKMLRRLIGEDILFHTQLNAMTGPIKADPAQIQQIIMNLVLNARDAMPNGGTLRLETGNVYLNEDHVESYPEAKPGPHAMLSVSDNGIGIPPEILGQIFEPFFTTKEIGKGTGLGLSSVDGIVKQSGGSITVSSKPMEGTSFKLYFPLATAEADSIREENASKAGGKALKEETILLAEDEPAVRKFLVAILKSQGYKVLDAYNGVEALRLASEAERIDLLLTDVIMPHMNGEVLAGELKLLHPQAKTLFVSGYTRDALSIKEAGNPNVAFLQKPFTQADLVSKLHEILGTGVPA